MPGLVNDGVADHGKRLRWAIALLIVVALASFTIASYLPSTGIASCHEELADSGIPVSVCGPIGAADIVLIGLVLLLAAALVLPELSEIGLPGGISIKRRVAELDREQRKTADDVRSLTLAQEVPDLGKTRRDLEERLKRWSQLPDDVLVVPPEAGRPTDVAAGTRVITEERPDLEERFMRLATEIDAYFRLLGHEAPERMLRHPAYLGRVAPSVDHSAYLNGVRRWAKDYDGPLRSWATARNVAAHFPQRLSDEEMRDAASMAEDLVNALKAGYLPEGAPRSIAHRFEPPR